jgi:hypothetical protein
MSITHIVGLAFLQVPCDGTKPLYFRRLKAALWARGGRNGRMTLRF